MPKWFMYCLFSILLFGAWGIVSKATVDLVSPFLGQILFTLGLLPLVVVASLSKDLRSGNHKLRGAGYGFLTGIFGGIGNVAFFLALSQGGKASTVVPVTAMYPLVTVITALVLLKEKLNRVQLAGVGLAISALILFSL